MEERGEQKKKRWYLLGFAVLITALVIGFLSVVNLSQPRAVRGTLDMTLLITGGAAAAALTVFIFKGDIFDDDGKMLKNAILFMMIAVICIVQFTLLFATFSFRLTDFNRESLEKSTAIFETIRESGGEMDLSAIPLPDEIERIYSTEDASAVNPTEAYRFPLGERTIVMEISGQYMRQVILKILVDLLTVLVGSIILTVELVIFALKYIEDRFDRTDGEGAAAGAGCPAGGGVREYRMVSYVRQIAFLFYFASRMGTPFIALLAKRLGGSFFGIPENVLAGIPQSAEFLFTCVAIFLTSLLIEKQGWKLPFAGGLFIVAAGTVFSALAPDLAMFIMARAVVGVGYGFCWMTLRNFALFASTGEEKALCFALLNAGIYAGMNCGAVMGSILADIIGYVPVLLLSSGLTVLCAVPILGLENVRYVKPAAEEDTDAEDVQAGGAGASAKAGTLADAGEAGRYGKRGGAGQRITAADLLQLGVFIVLLIVPSCILGSYLGYYLPIYLTDLGGQVSDIGRAQLIYGLIIVYLGPAMVRVMQKYYVVKRWSVLYNLVFAGGLLLFGLWGGTAPAMVTMAVIGLADAFGFVAQNNYFLDFRVSQKLGHSKALSCISIIKKLAEMLGPMVFGFLFVFPGTTGVAVLGAVFIAAAVSYVALDKISERRKLA